jgi:hypothetical protein
MFGHAFSLSNANNDSVISSAEFDGEAKRTFAGYDQNKEVIRNRFSLRFRSSRARYRRGAR